MPRKLAAWCEQHLTELLADLAMLVSQESPSTDKALLDATADTLHGWLTDRLGPPAEFHRHREPAHGDVLTATYPGAPGEPVLLLGHYDTVWPKGTLTTRPFTVHNGRATGPGCYDMKAGLVTGVWALRALAAHDLPRPTVTFLLNGDEEIGSPASRPHIERTARGCAAAFVLEPGVGWDLKTERKGVGIVTLTTTGIEAHAGNDPAAGASAVHALAEIITQLLQAADPSAGTTINVGTITGGTARNVIAGQASCQLDLRVSTRPEADRIDAALAALRPADPRVTLTVTGGWNRPPMALTPGSRALFDLANEIATELRAPLTPISVGGGSDANFLAALDIPVLDGLGCSGAGAHARHEHVLIGDIPDRVALLAALLRRLAG